MYMILIIVEQRLHREISMVSKQYICVNNSGIGAGKWVAEKLKLFILYLDINNFCR
jgi:hypothetical protein